MTVSPTARRRRRRRQAGRQAGMADQERVWRTPRGAFARSRSHRTSCRALRRWRICPLFLPCTAKVAHLPASARICPHLPALDHTKHFLPCTAKVAHLPALDYTALTVHCGKKCAVDYTALKPCTANFLKVAALGHEPFHRREFDFLVGREGPSAEPRVRQAVDAGGTRARGLPP